ncbi:MULTISPECIES: hypothetical protein [unclassified Acinetobacter]|uniref:hypothetical protein n=1 Tax=unclassified Acinetobacter TaxID=196816 RepID=UPI0015D3E513|nr:MULTISPECIES: hypothetical protein [unclassified Acinetobacter]
MSFSLKAILTCFSFYTGAYLIYYFFKAHPQPLFLLLGVALIVTAWFLTPYPYERGRQRYDETMRFGLFFYNPLIFWFRLFSWPIRTLLSIFA